MVVSLFPWLLAAVIVVGRQPASGDTPSCEGPVPLFLRRPNQLAAFFPVDHNTQKLVSQDWPVRDIQWYLDRWLPGGSNTSDPLPTSGTGLHTPASHGPTSPGGILERQEFDLTLISEKDKEEAFSSGTSRYEEDVHLETVLLINNIQVPRNTAANRLQTFRRFNPVTKLLSRLGFIMDYSTNAISSKLKIPKEVSAAALTTVDFRPFCKQEMQRPEPEPCQPSFPYRTPDGTCNNLHNPLWGASFTAHRRVLPADYLDGVSALRSAADGEPLPSARLVSTSANLGSGRKSCNTVLLMSFGQFTDHDLVFTPITKGANGTTIPCCTKEVTGNPEFRHPECAPIYVPDDDPFYSAYGITCTEFVRSSPADRCSLGPRQQLNELTSYIDLSQVYGSTQEKADELRAHKDGLLLTQLAQDGQELLPPFKELDDECNTLENFNKSKFCFQSGDVRVNEHIGLTLVTTLLAREHNRLARRLQLLNPHWDDERLYQEARAIAIAQMQHITYNEYLPLVLGPAMVDSLGLLPQFNGRHTTDYDASLNAGISNEFATAAFRFGHSLIPDQTWSVGPSRSARATELNDVIMNPFSLFNLGSPEDLMRGGLVQNAPKVDTTFTNQVTGKLFQGEKEVGLDLVALNLQRGRDHGIPGYVTVRRACGLPDVTDFQQLAKDLQPEVVHSFRKIYRRVEDIDLFVGGLAERAVPGGLLGPTFACLLADQFVRLKRGDRFWFESKDSPGAFTTDQLRQLHQASLARIIWDNFPQVRRIQRWPLELVGAFNPELNRSSACIPSVDLDPWKE